MRPRQRKTSAPNNHARPTAPQKPSAPDALSLYYRDVALYPPLCAQEELTLATQFRQSNCLASRDKLIQHNLRLVIHVAKRFLPILKSLRGLSFQDLIAEGNIGLIKGIERFDPARGTRISTYVTYWIILEIQQAILKRGHTIRLPASLHAKLRTFTRILDQYHNTHPQHPCTEEHHHELPPELQHTLQEHGISPEDLAWINVPMPQSPTSLDTHNDELPTLHEQLADHNTLSPDLHSQHHDDTRYIQSLLRRLSPREQFVITQRFGLDGQEPKTLDHTAKEMKLTRERVRQIQLCALQKLKKLTLP